MRVMFAWLMVRQKEKEEWRFVLMGFGDQYAVVAGMSEMPEWYVDS